jgi:drug/metabolite transporter (DMT)-like permease
MSWWGFAIVSAICWGMQYVLLEALFKRVDFAGAFTFLSLANGLTVATLLLAIYPRQNWSQLWQSWTVMALVAFYVLTGTAAYLFSAFAIRDKNATLASLLEISYPVFIILFTALFLGKVHLNVTGFLGAMLILGGCALVLWAPR